MGEKVNKEKSEQLGMSFGKANGILRKHIMFNLVKQLDQNYCFKCGEEIETSDELSIEHKEPWFKRDTVLFWDLNNITFSHLRCNKPHIRRGGVGNRIISPEGQSWCSRCKQHLPKEDFSPSKKRWNGVHHECKKCK